MSIKFNKHGLRVNEVKSDDIKTSVGVKFLNENESDKKYIEDITKADYNWTPDWKNNVRGVDVRYFNAPVNGWLTINQSLAPVFINGNKITTLSQSGSYQGMLRSGDVITSDADFTYTFAPCKSELLDWRETPTDYDIWKCAIKRNEDGTTEVQNLYIPDASNWKENVYDANGLTITKVVNDKAYNGDEFVCNIQTEKIEKGGTTYAKSLFFRNDSLTTFNSDLSSLTDGSYMFYLSGLIQFSSNLSRLTQGQSMFDLSSDLKDFNSDLSSLEKGAMMFQSCSQLREFWCDLPSLTYGFCMFSNCRNLISFTSEVPLLSNGYNMFDGCSKLTTFTSSLSNLDSAPKMFKGCSLNQESIYKIANTIKDVSSSGGGGICIGNSPDVPTSVLEECGNIIYNKGWNVFFNDIYKAKIDITAENGFVPDASKWNEFILSNLPDRKITSVSDGKLFANDEVIGIIDSDNITDGSELMSLSYIESWDVPLTKLTNGYNMFYACHFSEFNVPLTNLTNGMCMFQFCRKLTTFNSDLSKLTSGLGMFDGCILNADSVKNIAYTINKYSGTLTLGVDSSILNDDNVKRDFGLIKSKGWNLEVNGSTSFSYIATKYAGCTNVSAVKSKDANYLTTDIINGRWFEYLPDLTNGSSMFSSCTTLTSFDSDLTNLTTGTSMFSNCSNLKSFKGNLSKLTTGTSMFSGCSLDEASLQNIANTIKDLTKSGTSGRIDIGCDASVSSSTRNACGKMLLGKGWTVYFNGVLYELPIDVTEEAGYIPDASGWNSQVYSKKGLRIVRVVDGVAYNE